MDWIELNPKYKKSGESTSTKGGVSKFTSVTKSKAGKGYRIYSTGEIRDMIQTTFPTRSVRNVWMGEKTKARKPRWTTTRESVVNARAQKEQATSKWVDIPEEDQVKLRSFEEGNADFKKPILAQKRVYDDVGKRGVFWTGRYTGEKITKSHLLDVDHLVSIYRGAASEFMQKKESKFSQLSQKYAFVRNTKNLVISTRKENRDVKKGLGLDKYVPPLKEARPEYAQAYHDVFEHYGMKMTVGEAAKYTEFTGKKPTVGLWNLDDSNKLNKFMNDELAKAHKMRSRKKE